MYRAVTLSLSPVKPLGTVRPGELFLMPLWVSLRFQERHVYTRPKRASPDLDSWTSDGVLLVHSNASFKIQSGRGVGYGVNLSQMPTRLFVERQGG
jgi:hypothetical protein